MRKLLKVLCILTFIYSGLNFVSYTVMAIPGEKFWSIFFEKLQEEEAVEQMMAQNPQMETMFELAQVILADKGYLCTMAFLCACSVIGAALMLKRRVWGFHVYTLAHLVMIAVPLILFRSMNFSIGSTIFSLIIIGLYALAMFKSKKSAVDNNNNDYTY